MNGRLEDLGLARRYPVPDWGGRPKDLPPGSRPNANLCWNERMRRGTCRLNPRKTTVTIIQKDSDRLPGPRGGEDQVYQRGLR